MGDIHLPWLASSGYSELTMRLLYLGGQCFEGWMIVTSLQIYDPVDPFTCIVGSHENWLLPTIRVTGIHLSFLCWIT